MTVLQNNVWYSVLTTVAFCLLIFDVVSAFELNFCCCERSPDDGRRNQTNLDFQNNGLTFKQGKITK